MTVVFDVWRFGRVSAVVVVIRRGAKSAQATSIMKSHSAMLVTLAAALVMTACGHEESKTAATAPASSTPVVTISMVGPASPGVTNSTIYISDHLRAACNIMTTTVKDAPKFDFDRSSILPEDQEVLGQIAVCLTTGALKGRSVKLVGRADPRGTQEYNMALGERRSNAVMKYLTALGVGAPQLSETSRGALDATSTDESTWRNDRRVDIDVLDV